MNILQTERLVLRRLSTDDSPFIVQLLNDPDWLRFIGDKSVRTLEQARDYLCKGPITMGRNGSPRWCSVKQRLVAGMV